VHDPLGRLVRFTFERIVNRTDGELWLCQKPQGCLISNCLLKSVQPLDRTLSVRVCYGR